MKLTETIHNITDYHLPPSTEARKKRRQRIGIPLAAAAGLTASVFAGGAITEAVIDNNEANTCVAGEEFVVAQRGDSVWSIAANLDPHADVRTTIDHIVQANPEIATPHYVLHEGETLAIPVCGPEK